MNTVTPRAPRTGAPGLSTPQAVALVAEREILSRLQSKAFVISTVILFVVALAGIVLGGVLSKQTSETPVAVTADAQQYVQEVTGLDVTEAADRADAERMVKSGKVDAAVVADSGSPTGFAILAKTSAPQGLAMQLSVVPKVEILEPSTVDPMLRYLVAIGFGILFLMAGSMFGGSISSSVVEEKQTRVVEILISSISTRALLAGKVIGNTVLAMAQILGLVAIAVIGLTVTGQAAVLSMLGAPIVWFAVFFLFGFVLLASLYAAAAALVSRMEDLSSTTFPITMLVMAPYMLVIVFNDNPLVLRIMSYVPFSAPVGMPMRLFLGEAQWWEPLVSLTILLLTTIGAIWLGAKIYDNTLLRMGSRVSLKEALRG